MSTRLELREASAKALNALSRERLLQEFAISRLANLTNLDTIGIPIYSSVRVLSNTLVVHAGKSLEADLARAGAIAEAIECEVSEHPFGKFTLASGLQLPVEERLEVEDCFPVRSSIVNDLSLLAWEEATNIQNGTTKLVPSDILWLVPRVKEQPFAYFQSTSNGLASGASLEDAILSGLYEIIERDGWSLAHYLMDSIGILPERVPLTGLPEQIDVIVKQLEANHLKLHLFDCGTDYGVPVFNATILDKTGQCAGTCAGYGAHLDAETALLRAITEAAQSRACYIAGARDDLLRRQFLLMKRLDQEKLDRMFSDLNPGTPINEYRKIEFPDVKTELRYLLKLIKSRGVSEVYVKDMGAYVDATLHVVRVFSPQCEPYRYDCWTPSLRCLSYAERKITQLKEQGKEDEKWTI
jgi:YcaO-like protein with predicted kinase domain